MARSTKSSKGTTKNTEEVDAPAKDETKDVNEIGTETGESESVEADDAVAGESPAEAGETTTEAATPTPDTASELTDETAAAGEEEKSEKPEQDEQGVPGVIPAHIESPPPPTPPQPVSSGPGAFGLVFGGLLAGAIGFLVATFAVPEGWPNPTPDAGAAVETAIAEQAERIDALSADLAALSELSPGDQAPVDLGPLSSEIAAVEEDLSEVRTELASRFDEIEARIESLEARPLSSDSPDGSAAMAAQMEAFRQQLDDVTAEAEARIAEAQDRASSIEAEAAASAEAAERKAALASVRAALDSGAAFNEPLSELSNAPEALTSVASEGVPTLSELQEAFPAAARSALSVAQTVPEDASVGERLTSFLRRQTNARSLAPREGDNVDAILSRAEAALGSGELDAAIDELSALPETARDAMSDWIDAAETRAAAVRSVNALETTIN